MKILFVVLCCISTVSNASVGVVTEQVHSIPNIQRKNATIQGAKGTALEMDDAIRTTQGKVGLTFKDDTKVQLTENSKLVIDSFVYDPNNKSASKLSMKVALGTVRYASGQISKSNPRSVALSTPTATIGVRGTDFTATVDELGRSTIILLPSCRAGFMNKKGECFVGEISITTEEGTVVLNQAFQATRVDSRESRPHRPVILNLTEDQIGNILILSPPNEFTQSTVNDGVNSSWLDLDFLITHSLENVLDNEQKEVFQDRLGRNLLETDFLANILDQVNAQLAAQLDALKERKGLLPDYIASSGVIVELDDIDVTLCREGNGDAQCITTPRNQHSTIIQVQGPVEIKNRVNSGNGTVITIEQN
jgi:hypothetical protein